MFFPLSLPVRSSHLRKRPTSITFPTAPEPSVLVADAFGDVYQLQLNTSTDLRPDENADNACVLGHFSSITHISTQSSYVVTADRDARVRISRWPQAYIIYSFCLGHNDVVSSVVLILSINSVLSAAVDGTLSLWDLDGTLKATISINASLLAQISTENMIFDSSGKPSVVTAVVPSPSDPDAAFFSVYGCNTIFRVSGLSRNALESVTPFVSFESSVTGLVLDTHKEELWTSVTESNKVYRRSLDSDDDSIRDGCKGFIELDTSDSHVTNANDHVTKFDWLINQRKKEMVINWKGKKRRYVEI